MNQPTLLEAVTTLIFAPLLLWGVLAFAWMMFCRFFRDPNARFDFKVGDGTTGTVKDIRVAWTLAILEDKQREMAKRGRTLLSGKRIQTETAIAVQKAREMSNGEVQEKAGRDRSHPVVQERGSPVRRIYPR